MKSRLSEIQSPERVRIKRLIPINPPAKKFWGMRIPLTTKPKMKQPIWIINSVRQKAKQRTKSERS